jgi:ribonuclease BN (tRNA processing enzyme)
MVCDRRTALTSAAFALAAGAAWPLRAAADRDRTRLVLLGTAGGPRPREGRSAPAQAIVSGGNIYVVDCGYGVARQLVLAGLSLNRIRDIFITHHHSDHDIDLGPLLQLAWLSGLTMPVDCWGPPPMRRMIDDYFRYESYDIRIRQSDEHRPAFRPLVRPHELGGGGLVMTDGRVRVTAAKVFHPPVDLALAYRFDAADRSIVISGDTRPTQTLIDLARGADVLVHEAMMPNRVTELVGKLPNAGELARSVLSHHTSAEQAGEVATAAGVKMLVLSHLVPAEDPNVPDNEWIAAARLHYAGPIVVGRDLMEI